MEIVSLKKPHFLWASFIYADLNGASPLNRDSLMQSALLGGFVLPTAFQFLDVSVLAGVLDKWE